MEILECTPCGHAVIGLDGAIQFANPAFLSLTGLTPSSVSLYRFQDLLTAGGEIFYETQFAPMLMLRHMLNEISFEIVQPGGKRVAVFVNAVAALLQYWKAKRFTDGIISGGTTPSLRE